MKNCIEHLDKIAENLDNEINTRCNRIDEKTHEERVRISQLNVARSHIDIAKAILIDEM